MTAAPLAEVLADSFDEWLHRMHGVQSSCRHEDEGEGMADAVRAFLAEHVAKPEVVEAVAEAVMDNDQYGDRFAEARAALAALLETLGGTE